MFKRKKTNPTNKNLKTPKALLKYPEASPHDPQQLHFLKAYEPYVLMGIQYCACVSESEAKLEQGPSRALPFAS